MIILLSAAALAAVQPSAQSQEAPSPHSEAMARHGHYCCCCEHESGSQAHGDCAEHMRHGAEQGGHQGH